MKKNKLCGLVGLITVTLAFSGCSSFAATRTVPTPNLTPSLIISVTPTPTFDPLLSYLTPENRANGCQARETATSVPLPTSSDIGDYHHTVIDEPGIYARWFVGLGPNVDTAQWSAARAFVDDFVNAPERQIDKLGMILEFVPHHDARDTISIEIQSGNGPDVVGPVGWMDARPLPDDTVYPLIWKDLAPMVKTSHYDLSEFDPALLAMSHQEDQLVGLPFALYPAALEWNAALFEKAGLQAPPAKVGERYTLPDGTQADWDWETLAKVAQLLTLDSNGRNATQPGFDTAHIIQYGFSWGHENNPALIASYWQAGSLLASGKVKGSYQAVIPAAWQAAWAWTSSGMHGPQPFITTDSSSFENGKAAMTIETTRYLSSFGKVKTFQFGVLPAYHGQVSRRLDMETLRMWAGSKVASGAFLVLTSLIDQGSHKLFVECNDLAPAFDAVPVRVSEQQAFVNFRSRQFPWVKNWDTLLGAIKDPQTPAGEDKMPNIAAVWDRLDAFGARLAARDLDLLTEEAALVHDLNALFNK